MYEGSDMHIGILNDQKTKEENIKAGRKLCDRCSGTGNELFSMYRRCPDFEGEGYMENPKIYVFQINECCWFAGYSLEECIEEAAENYDEQRDDEAREVSDIEMKRLKFFDEDTNETMTFAEQLDRMIAKGEKFPTLFAHTEC